jgi:hypothetical protein
MSLETFRAKVKNGRHLKLEAGQVAVEYILLLAVGVAIWLVVMNGLVSRNPQSPGVVIKKWQQIIEVIGKDHAE